VIYFKFRLFAGLTVRLALIELPANFLGLILGIKLKKRIPSKSARQIALSLLLFGGILGIVNTLI